MWLNFSTASSVSKDCDIASEGAGELPIRLDALSEAEHGRQVLPVYTIATPRYAFSTRIASPA
jgi:hypothetical protein